VKKGCVEIRNFSILTVQGSGKHKIVSGCSENERLDFGSGTKGAVIPKKEVITVRNLKDWTKFTIIFFTVAFCSKWNHVSVAFTFCIKWNHANGRTLLPFHSDFAFV
jgi:hypothetical protein